MYICARAHVMGAVITQALDSPYIMRAGEANPVREVENCPPQESAMTPYYLQNKAWHLGPPIFSTNPPFQSHPH